VSEDKDSRTEDPTEKRLSKAREDGDVPLSQEMGSLGTLVAALVIIAIFLPWMLGRLSQTLSSFIEHTHAIPMDLTGLRQALTGLMVDVAVTLAPAFGLILLIGVSLTLMQVGFLWAPKKMQPKLSKVNPLKGVAKLFSKQKLVDLGKAILKLVLVGVVVWVVVLPLYKHPDAMIQQDFMVTLHDLHWMIILLLFAVTVVFTAVAIGDLVWQRHQHAEKLKMSKQEVKDERKQSEGDPMVKGRIAKLRVQRSRERMMQAVPTASVVITNPTHYAIALFYDSDTMGAPKLVAKGVDHLALRIRAVAEENDVPIVENPPLARGLYALVELDHEIPPEHYKAVAEVIGYVMRLRHGMASAGPAAGRR
jgi:flagellar biosynthetic protein FlhB